MLIIFRVSWPNTHTTCTYRPGENRLETYSWEQCCLNGTKTPQAGSFSWVPQFHRIGSKAKCGGQTHHSTVVPGNIYRHCDTPKPEQTDISIISYYGNRLDVQPSRLHERVQIGNRGVDAIALSPSDTLSQGAVVGSAESRAVPHARPPRDEAAQQCRTYFCFFRIHILISKGGLGRWYRSRL